MITILKGELYKFIRNRKNILIFALTLIFLAGFVVYTTYREKQFISQRLENLTNEQGIAVSAVKIRTLRYKLEPSPELKAEIDFWKKEESLTTSLKSHYKFYEKGMVPKIMNWEIERSANRITGYQKGYLESYPYSVEERIMQMQRTLDTNRYFVEQELVPYETPYTMNGINFLYLLMQDFFPLVFLFIIFLYAIDIYIADLECGSYKLLYSLPYRRGEIFFAKQLTVLMGSMLGTLFAIAIFFAGISLKSGVGDVNYPVTIFLNSLVDGTGWHTVNETVMISRILQSNILMFLTLLIFMNVFMMWVSIIADSSSLIIGLTIGFFLVAYSAVSFNGVEILRDYLILTFYPIVNQTVEIGIKAIMNRMLYVWAMIGFGLMHGYWLLTRKNFLGGKE